MNSCDELGCEVSEVVINNNNNTNTTPCSVLSPFHQEWQELEAAKPESDENDAASGQEKVPALLQMAANQVQQDESLTEVRHVSCFGGRRSARDLSRGHSSHSRGRRVESGIHFCMCRLKPCFISLERNGRDATSETGFANHQLQRLIP